VSQAQSFLYQLAERSVPLDAKALAKLTKIKVERRFFPGIRGKRGRIVARGTRTWLAMVRNLPDSALESESRRIAAAERRIAKLNPKAEPSVIKLWGKLGARKRTSNGDMVCVGSSRKRGQVPYIIHPPAAVLYKQEGDKCTLLFYDPEMSRPLVPVKWREFQRLLKTAGISSIKPTSIRAITADQATELQRIWPQGN
jgi:hypothetical protein